MYRPVHAEEDQDRVMVAKLRGVRPCMRAGIPRMIARGSGSIVNAASIPELVAVRKPAAYRASKHAVVGLTRAAALDYAKASIRVSAVCPGYTRTPMIAQVIERDPESEGRMVMAEPMGRLATPEEVAEALVWPCSDSASFVTGPAFAADGGLLAR